MDETLLRFRKHGTLSVVGKMVQMDLMNSVNNAPWMGRDAESCKVVKFEQARAIMRAESTDYFFTVSHRPRRPVHAVEGQDIWSGLWSDGWKIKHISMTEDGMLLDAAGNPLPDGQPPVIVEQCLFKTVDYNLFDFGEQIG